jgi:hypothetical protein
MLSTRRTVFRVGVVVAALVLVATVLSFSQTLEKPEEFQATAFGQGTSLGETFGVTIIIQAYSPPEEQTILLDAFNKAGMNGVTNALQKFHSKGRIAITGTLGADLAYVRTWPTPTGRKIRGVTNRPIRFGEAWYDGRSMDYNMTAFELDISDEKGKSTGTLIPACQIQMDKKTHEMQIETFNSPPWKLVDILDWKKM